MAPKRAAAKAAQARPKANTGAKVTKPAPKTNGTSTKRATTTKAKEPVKASVKTAAPKKAATKPIRTTTTTKRATTKRKADDNVPAPAPAKKAKAAPKSAKPAPKSAKAAPKSAKAAPKGTEATITTTITTKKTASKRKADDDTAIAPAPAKKAKVIAKGKAINEPPKDRLHIFVFGEGTAGELGLGTPKNAVDVKRPRLNPHLAADKVGVVQIAAGGMHVVALTHDSNVLSWGVNDQGALGRDTEWEGRLKAADAPEEDDEDDEDDNGLNPKESMPAEVDWSDAKLPDGTRFTAVAAGDSISLALTDDGKVYGWGTFRGNEGPFGFSAGVKEARLPRLIPGLKNITDVKCGANHALALSTTGQVFAWGSGQQNQLGRRVVERTKIEGLSPREFGLPKGPKKGIKSIETGGYHNFAISKTGDVYSWGLNNFGETGIMDGAGQDDASILKPQVIEGLKGKNVISIKGGGHHSIAAIDNGDCLVWGRMDASQSGIPMDDIEKVGEDIIMRNAKGQPAIIMVPTKVTAINGKATHVTACSDHNVVVTREGKAYSWGFSANYQTGLGTTDDVTVATLIDNTAIRDMKLTGATAGGQFSILTAKAYA